MAVPFVDIAEEYNVPYGVVLLNADRIMYDRGIPMYLNGYWWGWAHAEASERLDEHAWEEFCDAIAAALITHRPDMFR